MNSINRTKWILGLAAAMLAIGCAKKEDSSAGKEMVLRHTLRTRIQTMDPGNVRDVYSQTVVAQIYEPLYTYHFLKRPYEIISVLAEDLPQISADGRTCTIRIKKGVRFQDDACFPGGKGRQLKASDFVYAFKRIANVKYASQNWSILDGRFVGLDAFREYTKGFKKQWDVDYSRPVEGLQALDDYTLQIKLTEPWPQLVEMLLSDTCVGPMPYEAVDYYKEDIIRHPVGTGPFRLAVYQPGCFVEMVRNANWRGELYPSEGESGDKENGFLDDAGKPVPFADRIIWRIVEEDQPAWLMLMRGYIDAMAIPKDNFGMAISAERKATPEMTARGIELKTFNDPSTFWIGFNLKDPVLGKNLPLRKALSRAIDRQRFIDLFFDGTHKVAHGIFCPGLDAYDPNIAQYGYSKYDPAEARQLLKEAEKIHGGPIPKLTVAMPGVNTFYRQFGLFLQQQCEQSGITLGVDYMDWPTYIERMNKGQCQILASGISAGCPDSIGMLEMFATKYFAPGLNSFFYSNPAYDALYDKVRVMQSSPERLELYRKMERMVLDDYPAVFLNHRVAYTLNHVWYKNYKPNVFCYGVSKYRRVDVKQREEYPALLKKLEREGK
jgi:ABC-type transport system substrate-binding protein